MLLKRRWFRVVVLCLIVSSMAASGFAAMRPRWNYYFTDSGFSNLVGIEYDPGTMFCDDYYFEGELANYKMVDIYDNCYAGAPSWRYCYQKVGTAWQLMPCP